jgi:hypothetical protein
MLRPRSQLQVEVLEDRSVPAVTVLGANAADVSITGDNQSNDIFVTLSSQGIEVHANGSTTLALNPSTPANWIVTNTSTLIILNPNGPNQSPTLDNLYISMLNGDDKVSIGACTINNNLVIRDSPGGNDIVIIDNTIVGNNTYIYLTSGNDKVFPGGNDVVRFIPGTVIVGGNLGILTGGGRDRVLVDPGTSGAVTLKVFGTTSIRTGLGNDLVSFGVPFSTTTGPTVDLQATVIDTGAGNDRIYMRDAIMSLLVALLGDGDDTVMNKWGTDNVTVGFGSLLDGGNHIITDSLPSSWTPPANLTVINFP